MFTAVMHKMVIGQLFELKLLRAKKPRKIRFGITLTTMNRLADGKVALFMLKLERISWEEHLQNVSSGT